MYKINNKYTVNIFLLVYVGYKYSTCERVVWTVQATTLRGYDMDISELGSWNLDVHHRYNFHEGIVIRIKYKSKINAYSPVSHFQFSISKCYGTIKN